MGLRGRLAAFFVVITVLPFAVAVVSLQMQVLRQRDAVTGNEVAAAEAGASLAVRGIHARVGDAATDLALEAAQVLRDGTPAQARALVGDTASGPLAERADLLLLIGPEGTPAGYATTREAPAGAPSADAVAAAVVDNTPIPGAIVEARRIRTGGRPLGWAVAGVWPDETLLEQVPGIDGAAVVQDGKVLAQAGQMPDALPSVDGVTDIDGRRAVAGSVDLQPGPGGPRLILWRMQPTGAGPVAFVLATLIPATLVAASFGWILAGTIVAPVRRAADAARSIAGGDLEQKVPPTGGRELADLAEALNTMSEQLSTRLRELESSRDELRLSLSRLGRTLSSSLDLDRTLALVVETAMGTLEVDRAMLRLFTPERDALYVKVGRGVGRVVPRLGVGEGIAGFVARSGVPLRLPADADTAPPPAPQEPEATSQLVVPMVGRGQIIGVLSLLRDSPRGFTASDLDTVRSFAAQASVAVENVMLHHEAQRLSVTDPLTGLWNFRYFQLQADRELESAARFERPLSLLIVDLDHFKAINDVQGHQVGDEVLVEVARRIQSSTRVPDVVARYGGEEFVVLLPGTDAEGARSTAERIRGALSSEPITVSAATGSPRNLTVTSSVGAAAFPEHGTTAAALLRSADAAMYSAKAKGRDRVVIAPEGPVPPRRRRSRGT